MIEFLLQAASFFRNTPDITMTIQTKLNTQVPMAPIHHHICVTSFCAQC